MQVVCGHSVGVPYGFAAILTRVRQVVVNSSTMAVKSPRTARSWSVTKERPAPPADIRVKCADTGIGIPPERDGSAFQSFPRWSVPNAAAFGGPGWDWQSAKQLIEDAWADRSV